MVDGKRANLAPHGTSLSGPALDLGSSASASDRRTEGLWSRTKGAAIERRGHPADVIFDQASLLSSKEVQGTAGVRGLQWSLVAVSFGIVAFFLVAPVIRDRFLPGGAVEAGFLLLVGVCGFLGLMTATSRPHCAARVVVDQSGVVFEGGTTRTWSVSWTDPKCILRVYSRPLPRTSGDLTSRLLIARGRGLSSSFVMSEVYDALIRQASAAGLRVTETRGTSPPWQGAVISAIIAHKQDYRS